MTYGSNGTNVSTLRGTAPALFTSDLHQARALRGTGHPNLSSIYQNPQAFGEVNNGVQGNGNPIMIFVGNDAMKLAAQLAQGQGQAQPAAEEENPQQEIQQHILKATKLADRLGLQGKAREQFIQFGTILSFMIKGLNGEDGTEEEGPTPTGGQLKESA